MPGWQQLADNTNLLSCGEKGPGQACKEISRGKDRKGLVAAATGVEIGSDLKTVGLLDLPDIT
jgi:hypothetical protein